MDLIPGMLLEFGQLKQNEMLCRQLYDRALFFWHHVSRMTNDEKVSRNSFVVQYQNTLSRIIKVVRKHLERKLFRRIWSTRKYVELLEDLHQEIDDLYKLMVLEAVREVRTRTERIEHDIADDRIRVENPAIEDIPRNEAVVSIISIQTLAGRCGEMHEAELLCHGILSRLERHLGAEVLEVRPSKYLLLGEKNKSIKAVTSRFEVILKNFSGKPILWRLVSARSAVNALFDMHIELDQLDKGSTRSSPWQSQWKHDVDLMKKQLASNVERNRPSLTDQLPNSTSRNEALTLLANEVLCNKDSYSKNELDFLANVLSDIVSSTNLTVPEVEDWFIPRHEVQFDEDDGYSFVAGGSFGKVYIGKLYKTNVAVKCIDIKTDADRNAFLREVRIWKQLRHPHIVPFLGACHVGSPCFIVSEFAEGETLPKYLWKTGRSQVWRILKEVGFGLYCLHQNGVVHGDLKGGNILVSKDGTAMLSDFGLSFKQTEPRILLENWGAIQWRAPEYAVKNGAGPSFAADVYSFGICIVEAVTGKQPWGDLPAAAVKHWLRNKRMISKPKHMICPKCSERSQCPECPAWGLVERMCTFKPSERISLEHVIVQLERFADEEQERESFESTSSTVEVDTNGRLLY